MEIDIITYTELQLAHLTEEQLQAVQSAQMKKNRLARELAEKLRQEKRRLINNGMFLSYTWDWTKTYWERVYEEEIGWVRDGLLFYLQYTPVVLDGAPYEIDFSLSLSERRAVVQAYYMQTYTTYKDRFSALKTDVAAANYLCEGYKAMLDFFEEAARTE